MGTHSGATTSRASHLHYSTTSHLHNSVTWPHSLVQRGAQVVLFHESILGRRPQGSKHRPHTRILGCSSTCPAGNFPTHPSTHYNPMYVLVDCPAQLLLILSLASKTRKQVQMHESSLGPSRTHVRKNGYIPRPSRAYVNISGSSPGPSRRQNAGPSPGLSCTHDQMARCIPGPSGTQD